ncbi:MAG: hypothetical protein RLZ25_1180 [Pseudomonadota bacterium]|jgi:16S rRNA (uracil1498-N3)-methyltransferase
MRISRIFVPAIFEAGQALEVEGETSHYLKTVLRLRKGWKLILFDGQGQECPATVESFGRDSTILRLEKPSCINRESTLEVRLALGISRGERMDFAIQKAVELGVHHISPLLTEFCVVRLDEDKKDVRHTHWQRVIRSAMEQCGRNWMPAIDPPIPLDEWLETRQPFGQEFVLDPVARSGLHQVTSPPQQMTLLIGPEGGLSDQERSRAIELGFQSLRLGPRILRTETAVIAALSAVQTLWGDLGVRAD